MAFEFSPAIISYAGANVVAGAVTFPTIAAAPLVFAFPITNANFPKANCRQMIILNTGATTVYFGSEYITSWTRVPPPFNPAGPAIVPILAENCTPITAGASLSIELDTYEKRGPFSVTAFSGSGDFAPCTVIFFAAAPATNASVIVTYINTNGPF